MKKKNWGISRAFCAILTVLTLTASFPQSVYAQEVYPDGQEEIMIEDEEKSEAETEKEAEAETEKEAEAKTEAEAETETESEDEFEVDIDDEAEAVLDNDKEADLEDEALADSEDAQLTEEAGDSEEEDESGPSEYSFKWSKALKLIVPAEGESDVYKPEGISGVNGKDYFINKNAKMIHAYFEVDPSLFIEEKKDGGYKVSLTYNGKVQDEEQYYFTYDKEESLCEITFWFPENDSCEAIPGNLELSVSTVSSLTRSTFKWTGSNISLNNAGRMSTYVNKGFASANGKDYFIVKDVYTIDACFNIGRGFTMATDDDGNPKVTVTYNGKAMEGDDSPYYCNYYEEDSELIVSIALPTDNNNDPVPGNIVVNISTVSVLSRYTFKWNGNVRLCTEKGYEPWGIDSKNGKDYFLRNDCDAISGTFTIADTAVISKDKENEYKVSATYNGKKIIADADYECPSFNYEYDRSSGILTFDMTFNRDDAGNCLLGNIVISITTESKKLFSFSGKCGEKSVMTVDPLSLSNAGDNQKGGDGILLSGGKYYFDDENGYISATFKIDEGYRIAEGYKDQLKVKVTVGTTVIDNDHYNACYTVDLVENTIIFSSPTSFVNSITEKEISGNINLAITFVTEISSYVVTYSKYLTPYETEEAPFQGVVKQSGKYYAIRYAESIDITFKVQDGYCLANSIDKDGDAVDYKLTVKVGSKVLNDDNCLSVYFDNTDGTLNIKADLTQFNEDAGEYSYIQGDISVSGTFSAYKKAIFDCNFDEIDHIIADAAGTLDKDNNVLLIEEGPNFYFTVKTIPGYEVRKVTCGKTELKSISPYEYYYMIPKVKGDQTIKIETGKWSGKEYEPVPVKVLVDGKEPSRGTALVEFVSGVTYNASKKQYYTEKSKNGMCSKVEFKLTFGKGRELDSEESRIFCGDHTQDIYMVDGAYSIDQDNVRYTMIDKTPITISVVTRESPFKVTFNGADKVRIMGWSSETIRYWNIDWVLDQNNPYIYIHRGDVTEFSIELYNDYKDDYEITEVKLNGKKLEPVKNEEYRGFDIYELSDITADSTVDVVVKKIDKRKTITVSVDEGVKSVRAKVYGSDIEGTPKNGGYEFKAEVGQDVTFVITAKDHYKITSVIRDGDTEVQLYGDEAEITVEGDTTVNITTEGIAALYLKKLTADKTEGYYDNNDVTIAEISDKYEISVKRGKENLAINGFELSGIDKESGFATLSADKKTVDINCSKAEGVPDEIRVDIKCEGLSEGHFLRFVVIQPINAVTLSGFENNTASQISGTTNSYSISLNKGTRISDLKVSVLSGSDKNCKVYIDAKGGKLVVETFKGTAVASSDITIAFKNKAGKDVGQHYVITVEKPRLGAATVKAVSSTDVDITVRVTAAVTEGYKNTYIKVNAEAVTTKKKPLAEGMSQTATRFLKPSELSEGKADVVLNLAKEGVVKGKGAAQKYQISASIVQIEDTAALSTGSAAEDRVFAEGKTATVSVSTRKPVFGKKLTLKGKRKKFTRGESDISVATYSFSKNVTFRNITKVTLTGTAMNDAYSLEDKKAILKLLDDGKTIVITDSSGLYPGTYVLTAYPEGTGKPGTLKITVKAPVSSITIDAPSDTLVKAPKKAASIKIKTTCVSVIDGRDYKPANKKVKVTLSSDNEELLKYLNYKNGKVTVSKKYVPSEDPSMNIFTVTITAKDLMGKGTPATASRTFTITNFN